MSFSSEETTTILVLGGGSPSSPTTPPPFVITRIEYAANLYKRILKTGKTAPKIICLSGGTAHTKSLTTDNYCQPLIQKSNRNRQQQLGQHAFTHQIIYEATSCANHLQLLGVPFQDIYLETTSYDTIGNAYYTRLLHTDANPLLFGKRLLVITSDFHMERSKVIFDWIFGMVNDKDGNDRSGSPYQLLYHSILTESDEILSEESINSRKIRETSSLLNLKNKVIDKYYSLTLVHEFLYNFHELYSSEGLIGRSDCTSPSSAAAISKIKSGNDPILSSYGGGGVNTSNYNVGYNDSLLKLLILFFVFSFGIFIGQRKEYRKNNN